MSAAEAKPLRGVWIACALVGIVALLASWNVWSGEGILNTRAGGDSPFLLIRTAELAENLRAGVFPARWMPNAAYGLGYPFFHFYAALPYYLAAIGVVAGLDLLLSVQLVQTIGMVAAAFSMYLFCRRRLGEAGAALAGAAYTLAPFHLVNVYVRGDSLSEFWAFVWFPLILLGIERAAHHADPPSGAWLALALAALALTHNVSVLLFAPIMLAFAAATLLQRWRIAGALAAWRGLMSLGIAATAALLATAWFWLPALSDTPLVQLDNQTTGYFNYRNHFRRADLVQLNLLFDYTTDAERDPFRMGLVQMLLTLAGAAMWLASSRRVAFARPWFAIAGFSAATCFITPLSGPLWELITPLQLAQFPWRWLSIQSLFSAWLIGGLALAAGTLHRPATAWLAATAATATLLVAALAKLPNDRLHIRSEDVTPEAIQFYEWYTGNIGTTIRAEYLPKAAQPRPYVGPALLGQPSLALPLEAAAEEEWQNSLLRRTPLEQTWQVWLSRPLTLAFPMLDHPRLEVRLDGIVADERRRHADSWVAVALPEGAHTLVLRRAASVLETAALCSSALVTTALLAAVGPDLARRRRVIAIAGVMLLMALIGAWLVSASRTPLPAPMRVVDFARRPFPHRGPVVFENTKERYVLVGVNIAPEQLRSGETFTLTLQWAEGRAPAGVTVTQELPMGGEFIQLFRYARLQQRGDAHTSQHRLLDALPGPLLLRLQAFDTSGNLLQPRVGNSPVSALIAGAEAPAITLVGPIVQPPPSATFAPPLITFPSTRIALQHLDWFHTSHHAVCLRPQWRWADGSLPRAGSWAVSLRLRGSDGRLVAQADNQPQGGLAPTWAWPTGQLIFDSHCVPLKDVTEALRPLEPYELEVVWYRRGDLQLLDRATLRGTRGTRLEDLHEPKP